MKNLSPELDAYIAKSPEFARPILEKLRKLFHKACPQIEESMKWGRPFFEYKGIVANMSAFKTYLRWGFWKGKLLKYPDEKLGAAGMKLLEGKITDVKGLPPDKVVLDLIRQAVALNEQGVKVLKAKKPAKPELVVPNDLLAALEKDKKAKATFDGFSLSHQREYVEWIAGAKSADTRSKRLATALEWMAEGKSRNWKYVRK
jgi:uncharacterized protein YdeI (YjbR/CyaY-like superfamily)